MGLPFAARPDTPVARTSLFYFTLFSTVAIANPYLGIWLTDRGVSPEQIGIVNALPILIMVVLNLVVGRLADRARDWRTVIVIGSLIAILPALALLLAEDYLAILVVWTLLIVPFQAIAPVADAASLRMARRTGADFARMRVWGTVGFVVFTIGAGFVLDYFGAGAFVPLLIVTSVLRALASLQLPLFRAPVAERPAPAPVPDPKPKASRGPVVAQRLRELFKPWFLLPLFGAALVQGSHMMQMGFGALIWMEAGFSSAIIGPLWAVAPAGEILVMVFFTRIARRFSARHLILFACLVATVRWIGFALQPPLWALVVLQLSNMITFGLSYLGIINFIANWTGEDMAAEAQSFYVVIRQIVTVLALSGFGVLMAHFGAGGFYGASAMAFAGALCVIASLILMSPRQERG
ncbi:MFS transporter [Arsenicitalea aurantiaca]|uniref:MFS transporter n=1 Tax=Arsenicitalea aurantiaca TaxID=1783274 RepID=A0A433XGW9_9HYPH|nr:MFS transporter [Arsenicitalea aurantiaca]RUT33158.1 MFS transporter [Arsenicitalea aurantiaca]